jgi:hypothetical protein
MSSRNSATTMSQSSAERLRPAAGFPERAS